MWTTRSEPLNEPAGTRVAVEFGGRAATYADVLRGWVEEASFRELFTSLLACCPYAAFRWETPPVTRESLPRPFEFVLLDCPSLARAPDADAFAEHFRADAEVVTFENLGRDATLVVPTPRAAPDCYGHLAAFLRSAPDSQRHALWRGVADALAERVGERPVWLSTAGAGVSWLHVRLDDRPKYYGFKAYRQIS